MYDLIKRSDSKYTEVYYEGGLIDVWLLVCEFLTGEDLAVLSSTSRTFYELTKTSQLWEALCIAWSGGHPDIKLWAASWWRHQPHEFDTLSEIQPKRPLLQKNASWDVTTNSGSSRRGTDGFSTIDSNSRRRSSSLETSSGLSFDYTNNAERHDNFATYLRHQPMLVENDYEEFMCIQNSLMTPTQHNIDSSNSLSSNEVLPQETAVPWGYLFSPNRNSEDQPESVLLHEARRSSCQCLLVDLEKQSDSSDTKISPDEDISSYNSSDYEKTIKTKNSFTIPWKELWISQFRSESNTMVLSDSRLIWRVNAEQLFRLKRACLSHIFRFPERFIVPLRVEHNGSIDICVDFSLDVTSSQDDDTFNVEFWARKISPQNTAYGGFHVSLIAPRSLPEKINYAGCHNKHTNFPDIRRSIWQETGLQWGWDSFLKSREETEGYCQNGYLFFDIKWLHSHVAVDQCLKLNLCSYRITGSTHVVQPWYQCLTCRLGSGALDAPLSDPYGCCETCAKVCHQGHDVRFQRITVCYCDCGAGITVNETAST